MIAIVNPDEPGRFTSPYHPTVSYELEYNEWKAEHPITCVESGNVIKLPPRLPEWIREAVVAQDRPLITKEPDGEHLETEVSPLEWIPGKIIVTKTDRKLRLPLILPPLPAEIIDDEPGCIRSPFAPSERSIEVARRFWIPNSVIQCPVTKRHIKLPPRLPKIPSDLPKIALVVFFVALIIAIIFISMQKIDNNSKKHPNNPSVRPTETLK